jgi:4-aminobutyrate aminotransferase/(S)-3-amino-2-methylpropionate transaminase
LVKHNYENGVITLSCGTHGNVLRFLIPLVATEAQLNEGLDVVEAGLAKLG